jgi:hypothetical protein
MSWRMVDRRENGVIHVDSEFILRVAARGRVSLSLGAVAQRRDCCPFKVVIAFQRKTERAAGV